MLSVIVLGYGISMMIVCLRGPFRSRLAAAAHCAAAEAQQNMVYDGQSRSIGLRSISHEMASYRSHCICEELFFPSKVGLFVILNSY